MTTCTADQVRFFRAKRQSLVTLAQGPLSALQQVLGTQSQVLESSLAAVAMRSQQPLTKDELKRCLFDQRSMVRTWGPRETVYLYKMEDWPLILSAKPMWARTARQGARAGDSLLDDVVAGLSSLNAPFSRDEVMTLAPESFVQELEPIAMKSGLEPRRFAASRLIFCLAQRGDCCHGPKVGRAQTYCLRTDIWPDRDWALMDPLDANQALVRRYLRAFGPATVQDIAHYFGARIRVARTWLPGVEESLVDVVCEDRQLMLLAEDLDELLQPVPTCAEGWPVRLLPSYDTLLMGHADKSLLVPSESCRKQIYKSAARVLPTVYHRGRLVATYQQKVRKRSVTLTLCPLEGFDNVLRSGIEQQATRLARHLDVPDAIVEMV